MRSVLLVLALLALLAVGVLAMPRDVDVEGGELDLAELELDQSSAAAEVASPLVDDEQPEPAPMQESEALLFQAGAWPALESNLTSSSHSSMLRAAVANKDFVLYKQCDGRWAKNQLGTSRNTICTAGCAMSSLAMSLASYGVKIGGAVATPASLNSWLRSNGGYASGDLLVWTAANRLGRVKWEKRYSGRGSMSASALNTAAKAGKPVIVNVRNGGHWVLVTGPSGNGRTFPVNDPGFAKETYEISEMINFVVYSV